MDACIRNEHMPTVLLRRRRRRELTEGLRATEAMQGMVLGCHGLARRLERAVGAPVVREIDKATRDRMDMAPTATVNSAAGG
jgi:hypothetical protein